MSDDKTKPLPRDIATQVGDLAGYCVPVDTMADSLGMDRKILKQAIEDHPTIGPAYRRGLADAQIKILKKQFLVATRGTGSSPMLIWLGKQYLGQRDKQEVTGVDGGPIEIREIRARLSSIMGEVLAEREADQVASESEPTRPRDRGVLLGIQGKA